MQVRIFATVLAAAVILCVLVPIAHAQTATTGKVVKLELQERLRSLKTGAARKNNAVLPKP